MMLKVVVADDNPAVLRRLVSLLATEFEVVSTAEVTRRLRKLGRTPAVVICSVESDQEMIEAAQQAGALGYVFKKSMDRDLVKAVKSAARGETFISSR